MILVRRSTGQIYAKSNNREYLERLREKYEARDILCDIEERNVKAHNEKFASA